MTKAYFCKARSCPNLVLKHKPTGSYAKVLIRGRCSWPPCPQLTFLFPDVRAQKPCIEGKRRSQETVFHLILLSDFFPLPHLTVGRVLYTKAPVSAISSSGLTPQPLCCMLTAILGCAKSQTHWSHRDGISENSSRQSRRPLLPKHGQLFHAQWTSLHSTGLGEGIFIIAAGMLCSDTEIPQETGTSLCCWQALAHCPGLFWTTQGFGNLCKTDITKASNWLRIASSPPGRMHGSVWVLVF